jgi:hypothetical protein
LRKDYDTRTTLNETQTTTDERANKGACIYGTVIDDDGRVLTIYNDGQYVGKCVHEEERKKENQASMRDFEKKRANPNKREENDKTNTRNE